MTDAPDRAAMTAYPNRSTAGDPCLRSTATTSPILRDSLGSSCHDAELDHYGEQLEVILGAVARVAEVAADDVPPDHACGTMVNVTRPDIIAAVPAAGGRLGRGPRAEDDRFRVPRILDEEEQ